ncbi:MAG: PhaM family polyhydroxyalkanoate granule multifunctional regulatory protein [Caldimonas sp.]
MSDPSAFGKLVPGFDFLQGLVKNAGNALPGIGQWIAPTLDPAELEKRIRELRTVQYWLEQNARMLAATIQALEVQKMTLSTLRGMNVQMTDLTESLRIKPRAAFPAPSPAPARAKALAPRQDGEKETPAKDAAEPAKAIDPMQWWGALTTQFAQLATSAMKDTAADAAKVLSGGMVKQSFDAATKALKTAAGPAGAATGISRTASPARKAKKAAKRRRARPAAKSAGDGAQ